MPGTTTNHVRNLREAATEEARERARQELWRRGYDAMVRLAQRLLSHHDAEEVAADAFLHLFAKLQQHPNVRDLHSADFWTLLRTITRHEAVSRLRYNGRKKRSGVQSLPPEILQLQVSSQVEPPIEVELGDLKDDLLALDRFLDFLEELGEDPQLREIARLKYLHQADRETIARELGISQATYYRKHTRIENAAMLFEQRQKLAAS